MRILLIVIFLTGCATGNDPFMGRVDAQNYCSRLPSEKSDRSMCVKQLMLPSKYIKPCFDKRILPGTIEFTDCGRSVLYGYPNVDTDTDLKQKKMQDEIDSLKRKQNMQNLLNQNKVITK